jgi:shikimate dehydrogenase
MIQYPRVTTKLVILLGNPLGHSISPPMHNRVFEKLGMDYCYMPVEVTDENLKKVFSGLSKMNVAGFNVTIPHKINIIEYLDELDPLAATIGAVNTICVKDGKTKGYNTDGEGFIRSLEEEAHITARGKRVLLLGCGGAARAIAMTLAFRGAEKIYIYNRTAKKAEELTDEINTKLRSCAEVVRCPEDQTKAIQSCDILINSSSIGMHPHEDVLPIDESLLSAELIVADIVYNPLMTKLLRTARDKGCTIVPGLGMLIYQGAAAFKLFTGVEPLVEEMSEVVYSLMALKE